MSSSSDTTTSSSQPARYEAGSEWSVDALRTVWARQRGHVSERIDVLERALAALADDRLDADLRCEAERAAHTLAGSLAMFGFVSASDTARRLEQRLADPEPQWTPGLYGLLEYLQAAVKRPLVLCSDPGIPIPDGLER
jgi:HPt (histidine-containing phosphotransfer) domain-containing protein